MHDPQYRFTLPELEKALPEYLPCAKQIDVFDNQEGSIKIITDCIVFREDRDRIRRELIPMGIEVQFVGDDLSRIKADIDSRSYYGSELPGRLHEFLRTPSMMNDMASIKEIMSGCTREELRTARNTLVNKKTKTNDEKILRDLLIYESNRREMEQETVSKLENYTEAREADASFRFRILQTDPPNDKIDFINQATGTELDFFAQLIGLNRKSCDDPEDIDSYIFMLDRDETEGGVLDISKVSRTGASDVAVCNLIHKGWHIIDNREVPDNVWTTTHSRLRLSHEFVNSNHEDKWQPTEQDYREYCGVWSLKSEDDKKRYVQDLFHVTPKILDTYFSRDHFIKGNSERTRIEPIPEQCIPKQKHLIEVCLDCGCTESEAYSDTLNCCSECGQFMEKAEPPKERYNMPFPMLCGVL
jgi:hypothetical protein